jgi:hypothetical protein
MFCVGWQKGSLAGSVEQQVWRAYMQEGRLAGRVRSIDSYTPIVVSSLRHTRTRAIKNAPGRARGARARGGGTVRRGGDGHVCGGRPAGADERTAAQDAGTGALGACRHTETHTLARPPHFARTHACRQSHYSLLSSSNTNIQPDMSPYVTPPPPGAQARRRRAGGGAPRDV